MGLDRVLIQNRTLKFFAGAARRAEPDSMLILCVSVCVCLSVRELLLNY